MQRWLTWWAMDESTCTPDPDEAIRCRTCARKRKWFFVLTDRQLRPSPTCSTTSASIRLPACLSLSCRQTTANGSVGCSMTSGEPWAFRFHTAAFVPRSLVAGSDVVPASGAADSSGGSNMAGRGQPPAVSYPKPRLWTDAAGRSAQTHNEGSCGWGGGPPVCMAGGRRGYWRGGGGAGDGVDPVDGPR